MPFANAKPIAPTPKTKAGKGYKPPTDFIPGWQQYAALVAASKALAALVEQRREMLIEQHVEPALIEQGLARGRKPDSLHPVEGDAKGSAYLTKKGTRSPLSEDDLLALNEIVHNVGDFTEVVEESPELLAVNAKHAQDQALLEKVDAVLKRHMKDLPEDFIELRPAVSKTVVSETALDAMFKLDANAVEVLRPILATVALRPVYGASLEHAWDLIRELVPEAEEAEKSAPKNGARTSPKAAKGKLEAMLKASEKATK
jgi:hypothetical protein